MLITSGQLKGKANYWHGLHWQQIFISNWIIGCSTKIKENYSKKLLNKGKQKCGLKFNPGLPLIAVQTTVPWLLQKPQKPRKSLISRFRGHSPPRDFNHVLFLLVQHNPLLCFTNVWYYLSCTGVNLLYHSPFPKDQKLFSCLFPTQQHPYLLFSSILLWQTEKKNIYIYI